MKDKKTIVYLGNFPYPSGSGVGNRVCQNARMLSELGYSVCIVASHEAAPAEGPLEATLKEADGFRVCFLRSAKNMAQRFRYRNDLRRVNRLVDTLDTAEGVAAIVFTGTKLALFADGVVRHCKKEGIPAIADSMDWLKVQSGNPLFNLVKQLDITYEMRFVNAKADGVIAVSSYLMDFYSGKGIPAVRIPPLFAQNGGGHVPEPPSTARLLYAGTPFRPNALCKRPDAMKDRIDKTVALLHQAKRRGADFIFHIYGIDKEEFFTAFPGRRDAVAQLGGSVVFHGRVAYEQVRAALKETDFTILLRDDNRESRAGFPSKIAESINAGIPVITSNVGDHSLYVRNGKNGFLLEPDEELAVRQMLDILNTDGERRREMKNNCLKEKAFSYQTYLHETAAFLNRVFDGCEKHE